MTENITQERLDQLEDAYSLGVEDAKAGRYRPSAHYHFNDIERIRQYDNGHASVVEQAWRWTAQRIAAGVK